MFRLAQNPIHKGILSGKGGLEESQIKKLIIVLSTIRSRVEYHLLNLNSVERLLQEVGDLDSYFCFV